MKGILVLVRKVFHYLTACLVQCFENHFSAKLSFSFATPSLGGPSERRTSQSLTLFFSSPPEAPYAATAES